MSALILSVFLLWGLSGNILVDTIFFRKFKSLLDSPSSFRPQQRVTAVSVRTGISYSLSYSYFFSLIFTITKLRILRLESTNSFHFLLQFSFYNKNAPYLVESTLGCGSRHLVSLEKSYLSLPPLIQII